MASNLDPLGRLSARQYGNVTARQASGAGLSRRQVQRHIDDAVLERAGAHVLRSPFVERTPLGDLWALIHDVGGLVVASGPTALAVHGFESFVLQPPFHLTIERGRCVERPPHRIHTALDLRTTHRTLVRDIPVWTAARSVVDAAKHLSAPRLTVAYDTGLRDRRYTEDMVHEIVVELRRSGRVGIPKLLTVIEGVEAIKGGHSWLERRFLQICADHGLPRPETQRVLASSKGKLIRVDFRFPGTAVVGEVLGYRWHRGDRRQLSRDAERINALVMQGFTPLQFTYDHVTLEVAWVVSQLRTALG